MINKTTPNPKAGDHFITLFTNDGDGGGLSDEIVDLAWEEFDALKIAAQASGEGILMFLVKTAMEKIGGPGASPGKKLRIGR